MTGKLVNLNRAKKARARAEKRAKGDANAARFGRSKAEKAAEAQAAAARRIEAARLEGHRRAPDRPGVDAPSDDDTS